MRSPIKLNLSFYWHVFAVLNVNFLHFFLPLCCYFWWGSVPGSLEVYFAQINTLEWQLWNSFTKKKQPTRFEEVTAVGSLKIIFNTDFHFPHWPYIYIHLKVKNDWDTDNPLLVMSKLKRSNTLQNFTMSLWN